MKQLRGFLLGWRGIAALSVAALLIWLAARGLPDGRLHVYFLDVGQGDAIFIRTPAGQQLLIDGGPSPAALMSELGQIMPFWDRDLDLVALTHPDDDHLAGLIALFDRYRLVQVVDAGFTGTGAAARAWRTRAGQAAEAHVTAQRGTRLVAGEATLTVLHPSAAAVHPGAAPPGVAAVTTSGDNNSSLVLRLDYGATSFLFTGDAESEAEGEMLAAQAPLRADVLKVGHHGSAASTSPAFLAAVSPRLAVISVGRDNRFGHPAPAVLDRLAATPLLRTDLNGRIEIISDGRQLWVQTLKAPPH